MLALNIPNNFRTHFEHKNLRPLGADTDSNSLATTPGWRDRTLPLRLLFLGGSYLRPACPLSGSDALTAFRGDLVRPGTRGRQPSRAA